MNPAFCPTFNLDNLIIPTFKTDAFNGSQIDVIKKHPQLFYLCMLLLYHVLSSYPTEFLSDDCLDSQFMLPRNQLLFFLHGHILSEFFNNVL